MRLKMIRGPRPGQKEMVCLTASGAYSAEIGKVLEVSDTAGHEIMTRWAGCFEVDGNAGDSGPEIEPKIIKNYKNKKKD